jgi:hypothetical protein
MSRCSSDGRTSDVSSEDGVDGVDEARFPRSHFSQQQDVCGWNLSSWCAIFHFIFQLFQKLKSSNIT